LDDELIGEIDNVDYIEHINRAAIFAPNAPQPVMRIIEGPLFNDYDSDPESEPSVSDGYASDEFIDMPPLGPIRRG
jgi:hypothetical protein